MGFIAKAKIKLFSSDTIIEVASAVSQIRNNFPDKSGREQAIQVVRDRYASPKDHTKRDELVESITNNKLGDYWTLIFLILLYEGNLPQSLYLNHTEEWREYIFSEFKKRGFSEKYDMLFRPRPYE